MKNLFAGALLLCASFTLFSTSNQEAQAAGIGEPWEQFPSAVLCPSETRYYTACLEGGQGCLPTTCSGGNQQ